MKQTHKVVRSALIAAVLVSGVFVSAEACPYIQAVIDWNTLSPGGGGSKDIGAEEWLDSKGDASLPTYMLRDKDIMLPAGGAFGSSSLANLTGGIVYKNRSPGETGQEIDYYEIWAWVDVDNDGGADEDDVIGTSPQEWQCLLHEDGFPSEGSPSVFNGDAFSLLRGDKKLTLQSGVSYILVILVEGGIDEYKRTNFDYWKGEVAYDTETMKLSMGTPEEKRDEATEAPQFDPTLASASPLRYFDVDLKRMYDHDGPGGDVPALAPVFGLDDYEVLWVRVNNPPNPPAH